QQQLRLDEQGQGMLQFEGPPKFETNNAILEVELSEGVSKKTARRAVQTLPAVPSQLDVDFFPEGGDLIAGVTNHVYYRVRSPQGETVAPEGRVLLLSKDDVLLDAEPGQAVGSFAFVPDAKETYTLRITGPDGVTELADPFRRLGIKASGVVLHGVEAVSRDADALNLTLRNAGEPRTLLVLAACRGLIVGHHTLTTSDKAAEFKLDLPASAHGIVRLTVYDSVGGKLEP